MPRNFRVYAEFRETPRKHGNSAATAEFRGSARNAAARGKLWALIIMSKMGRSVIGKVVAAFVCAAYQFTGSVAETRLYCNARSQFYVASSMESSVDERVS